jgi:hypothetical protein
VRLVDNDGCYELLCYNKNIYDHMISDYGAPSLNIKLFKIKSIFEYDYKYIHDRCNIFKEELMAKMFHPDNMNKWEGWGFDEFKE